MSRAMVAALVAAACSSLQYLQVFAVVAPRARGAAPPSVHANFRHGTLAQRERSALPRGRGPATEADEVVEPRRLFFDEQPIGLHDLEAALHPRRERARLSERTRHLRLLRHAQPRAVG